MSFFQPPRPITEFEKWSQIWIDYFNKKKVNKISFNLQNNPKNAPNSVASTFKINIYQSSCQLQLPQWWKLERGEMPHLHDALQRKAGAPFLLEIRLSVL